MSIRMCQHGLPDLRGGVRLRRCGLAGVRYRLLRVWAPRLLDLALLIGDISKCRPRHLTRTAWILRISPQSTLPSTTAKGSRIHGYELPLQAQHLPC